MKGRLCWLRRHTGRRVQGSEGSGRCLEGVCLKQAGQKGSDGAEKRWGAGRDLGDILERHRGRTRAVPGPPNMPGDVLRGRPEDGPGAWMWCVLLTPLREWTDSWLLISSREVVTGQRPRWSQ